MNEHTHHGILEGLVFLDCAAITLGFMFFSGKVFDSLIIEQTVRVDTTRDLYFVSIRTIQEQGDTYNIALVHSPPNFSTPLSEDDACPN